MVRVLVGAPFLVEPLVGLNPARSTDARAIARLGDLAVVSLDWKACEMARTFGRALGGRGGRVPTVDLLMAGAAAGGGHGSWHVGGRPFLLVKPIRGPA